MGGVLVIPRWVARIVWAFRGKRRVRLHLVDPPKTALPSLEGVLVGRWGGHYVLLAPSVITSDMTKPVSGHIEVPAELVLFVQVLGGGS